MALLSRYRTNVRLLAGGTDLFLRLERRAVEPGGVVELMNSRSKLSSWRGAVQNAGRISGAVAGEIKIWRPRRDLN